MIKSFWQKNWNHFAAIAIFLIVAVIYCKPALEGLQLDQPDTQGWKGMAQQSFEYREKYGHFPYWTNSMFSGMPGYQIAFETPNKISIGYLHNYIFTLGLPKPINFFFLASITAYFLLCVLRINPWIGVMGGIAYAYATFNAIIVFVGHDTQMICIGYASAVIGSLLLLFERKYIWGTVLTALSAAMIIWQNHVQITYYTLLTALCLGISFIIHSIREGKIRDAITATALALVAGGIALGVNIINIWPMQEYARETMRGGRSELTDTANAKNKTKGGLDKDYAFAYSVGKTETFTFLTPRLYGGSSHGTVEFKPDSKLAKTLSEKTGLAEDQAGETVNQWRLSPYWGEQQGTSGPVYLGAVICLLFVLGLVYVKSWHKWWLVAATLIGIILAWGKNLEGINYFLFDHLPLYSKFRAPSMALVIPQLTFPVLACLALQQFLFDKAPKEELWKKLKLTGIIMAALFVILTLLYFNFDYTFSQEKDLKQGFANMMSQQLSQGKQVTPQIQQQADDFGKSMFRALKDDRQDLFGGDLLRSFLLVALAFGLLVLYAKEKLKPGYALAGIILLSCFDVLQISSRYLNYKNFVEPANLEANFTPTPADLKIKADPDKNFRVFDEAGGSPFQDARTSYHHNSIGGYSPVKLGLYQDIITRQLAKRNMNVFNMLNTKYFIEPNPSNGQPEPKLNPGAFGNCWFVKTIRYVKNADEEMGALDNLNPKDTVVIDERFRTIAGAQPQYESSATIVMKENLNDKILYESKSSAPQFAVFSEVYYPYGWDAYLDGKKVDYCRADYLLRGMPIPSGNHTIEFRFEPRSVILGDKITMWFNIFLYLMLIGAIVLELRKKKT